MARRLFAVKDRLDLRLAVVVVAAVGVGIVDTLAVEGRVATVRDTGGDSVLVTAGEGDAVVAEDGVLAVAEVGGVAGVAGHGALLAGGGVGEPEGVAAAVDGGGSALGLLDTDEDGLDGGGGGEEGGRGGEDGSELHFGGCVGGR
jgi:hypothetical protein